MKLTQICYCPKKQHECKTSQCMPKLKFHHFKFQLCQTKIERLAICIMLLSVSWIGTSYLLNTAWHSAHCQKSVGIFISSFMILFMHLYARQWCYLCTPPVMPWPTPFLEKPKVAMLNPNMYLINSMKLTEIEAVEVVSPCAYKSWKQNLDSARSIVASPQQKETQNPKAVTMTRISSNDSDATLLMPLMEEILHQLISRLSHYLHGLIHPGWVFAGFLNHQQ